MCSDTKSTNQHKILHFSQVHAVLTDGEAEYRGNRSGTELQNKSNIDRGGEPWESDSSHVVIKINLHSEQDNLIMRQPFSDQNSDACIFHFHVFVNSDDLKSLILVELGNLNHV